MNTENTNLGFGSEPNPSTWITINNGKLTVRATEDDEGAVIREYTNKDGERRSVWEYQYTNFSGVITGAEFEKTQWGMVFSLNLSAGDKEYSLRLQAPGRLFEQFAKRIPNLQIDQVLYIGAFTNEKGHNVLYLKQNGSKVDFAFTRDNPNGMPPAVQETKMGETKWNYDAQEEFLYNLTVNWIESLSKKGGPDPLDEVAEQLEQVSSEPVASEGPF